MVEVTGQGRTTVRFVGSYEASYRILCSSAAADWLRGLGYTNWEFKRA